MKTQTNRIGLPLLSLALALGAPACDLEISNLNALDLEEFQRNPTAPTLAEANVGLLLGHRVGKSTSNGFASIVGVLGREAYNFDPADPRYITELLEGSVLDPGSPAFGGNFWVGPYRNIKNSFIIENALPSVAGITEEQRSANLGFVRTIRALEFMTIVTSRWEVDVPIDVNRDINDELAPLVNRDAVFAEINSLLDTALSDLEAGGASFPFTPHSGFAGFDTPATFAQFNRAVRARAAAYQQDWQGVMDALAGSFISDDPADFDVGVYHVFSTGAGDAINGLSSEVIFVHPGVVSRVEMKANGNPDDRYAAKVMTVDPATVSGSLGNYTSSHRFATYFNDNLAPLAIIRNEELILLRAEAYVGMGDYPNAQLDLDLIRTASGGLEPLASLDATNAVDEILQQRMYSLLFEGGHRWIDVRRYDRLDSLLDDDENDGMTAHRTFPLPVDEQAARGIDQ